MTINKNEIEGLRARIRAHQAEIAALRREQAAELAAEYERQRKNSLGYQIMADPQHRFTIARAECHCAMVVWQEGPGKEMFLSMMGTTVGWSSFVRAAQHITIPTPAQNALRHLILMTAKH
jgi:hypothetical protein